MPFQSLVARALLRLLDFAVENDRDQERVDYYNELKPELERYARVDLGSARARKLRERGVSRG